jgi:hypothetical protein
MHSVLALKLGVTLGYHASIEEEKAGSVEKVGGGRSTQLAGHVA